jgi:hypothetical protein
MDRWHNHQMPGLRELSNYVTIALPLYSQGNESIKGQGDQCAASQPISLCICPGCSGEGPMSHGTTLGTLMAEMVTHQPGEETK